jgi:hypothetical protein
MYKSFYEQVFLQTRFNKGLQEHPSSPSRKARVFKPPSRRSYKIRHWRIFSYELFNARKKKNLVQMSYLKRRVIRFAVKFFVLWFTQFKESKGFHMTSYLQGQRSVCPKPRIPFFWFTSIGVQKQPVSVEVLAPTRLALRGSHVRRQYRKRTTLRSESSTIKGLLYARWSSCCKAFVARKVRTIALSEARESCHLTSNKCHMAWVRWRSRCEAFVARKARTIT